MKSRNEEIIKIARDVSSELIQNEKKNHKTKEKKDSEMIKLVKNIVERAVKRNEIQQNDAN